MKRWCLILSVAIAGCASDSGLIPYNVTTRECSCERFEAKDAAVSVRYAISAWYRVDDAITTRVVVDIMNESQDTLDLSLANVRVSSRNIPYTYNDKFIPVQIRHVLARGKEDAHT